MSNTRVVGAQLLRKRYKKSYRGLDIVNTIIGIFQKEFLSFVVLSTRQA